MKVTAALLDEVYIGMRINLRKTLYSFNKEDATVIEVVTKHLVRVVVDGGPYGTASIWSVSRADFSPPIRSTIPRSIRRAWPVLASVSE